MNVGMSVSKCWPCEWVAIIQGVTCLSVKTVGTGSISTTLNWITGRCKKDSLNIPIPFLLYNNIYIQPIWETALQKACPILDSYTQSNRFRRTENGCKGMRFQTSRVQGVYACQENNLEDNILNLKLHGFKWGLTCMLLQMFIWNGSLDQQSTPLNCADLTAMIPLCIPDRHVCMHSLPSSLLRAAAPAHPRNSNCPWCAIGRDACSF